ncbi:hypothetical protein CAPTEDRAFT_2729 [Capitella teleta]|uniref:Gamma-glutamyltransferase n=1 Tax=Capitella teleta TaxID=283909 RepID=R7TG92_CAPTE|nr:hypothetical protein CAPTEDRAFT_2729 [Capitella teleta]|eukprot:ELT90576.1 hypothetical protein CAPTEDRAFT_2729 [Capitella teleta]
MLGFIVITALLLSGGIQALESEYREYPSAAVTTETAVCSEIGAEILSTYGGSAVDSAIASIICVGVINHHSCGIGGGFFATIYESPRDGGEKVLTTILSRETAPLAAEQDMFVNNTEASSTGGLAIAVPGEIAGLYEAWKMFGRVEWAQLIQPTITLCEEGFEVARYLALAARLYETTIREDPNLAEIFIKEDGELIQEGDIITNEKLGQTMRRIAQDPMSFYTGSLAQDIVDDIAEYDGIITLEDLAQYAPKIKAPLNISLDNGDFTAFAPVPPSSGVITNFMLKVLDGYNFGPEDVADDENKILTYHRIAEAFKFAFARRTHLGDEDYWDVEDLVRNLTSSDYINDIRRQINDSFTQDIDYYGPNFGLDGNDTMGTSHMNVYTSEGSAVSLTSTINLFFGSKVRGSRTGIMFNNEMDDFSTPGTSNSFGVPASPANYIEPGKMPMSSMSPTMIFNRNGDVAFMTGAAGGTLIPTAVAFVTMNSLWFDKHLLEATDTPRLHHQLVPNELRLEPDMDEVDQNWNLAAL